MANQLLLGSLDRTNCLRAEGMTTWLYNFTTSIVRDGAQLAVHSMGFDANARQMDRGRRHLKHSIICNKTYHHPINSKT